eukprot:s301_g3.t1
MAIIAAGFIFRDLSWAISTHPTLRDPSGAPGSLWGLAGTAAALSFGMATWQWQWAIHLLEEMRPDVVTYNASMDACARGQQWQRCLTLFNEMFHSILYPTIISYNTAISACENGSWTLVLALLQDLRQQGLKARADTYSAAMAACSKVQQNDLALQLLSKVPRRFTPSRQLLVAYNSALNACAKGHFWMHSLQLLEEMSSADVSVSPDVVSFSSALTACGKGQHWEKSVALMQDLKDRSLQMNTFLCNAAMDSYSRSSQWQATLALLEDMRKQSQQPSMVAATLAVSAAASAAESALATDLLHHLEHSPDEAAYLGMLTACQEASLWDLALHLLDQGRQRALVADELPSQQLFSVAISALDDHWEAALAVLAEMKQDGPQPNLVVLNAAAKVLFHCGRVSEALALYRDAEDQGLASAEWLNTGRGFPEADLDLHCFPVEMAKLAVLSSLLDAALGVKRQGAGGLLLVTGAGGHRGTGPVLGPVLRLWLEEMGLPVEDGDWHGTRGRLWLSEDAIQELTGTHSASLKTARCWVVQMVLDQQFNIKVCDFGKTQELHPDGIKITCQDTGGSPRYMAPECFIVGQPLSEKEDIWSLGCCLVEILGGPLPYENLPMMSEVRGQLAAGIPPMVPP